VNQKTDFWIINCSTYQTSSIINMDYYCSVVCIASHHIIVITVMSCPGYLVSEKDNEESLTDIIYGFFIKLWHKHPLLKIKQKHAFNI